jgi:hypothetical protein
MVGAWAVLVPTMRASATNAIAASTVANVNAVLVPTVGAWAGLAGAAPLSNKPLQQPKPPKSSSNLEAQPGSGRRCIIDMLFTASLLNGKTFDGRIWLSH